MLQTFSKTSAFELKGSKVRQQRLVAVQAAAECSGVPEAMATRATMLESTVKLIIAGGAWCISSVQEYFHLVYSDAECLYPLPGSFHKRSIERNEVRPESVVLEKLLRY